LASKLDRDGSDSDNLDPVKESDLPESPMSKSSVLAHEMTPMVVVVRNNTKDMIKINLNITCRDVAGENCVDGTKSTVLWTGNIQFLFAFCYFMAFIWLSNMYCLAKINSFFRCPE